MAVGPWEAAGDPGPRVSESRSGEAMPRGPRARPSDGGGQADRQRRAVGEMSRTPPGGPPEGGDRRAWQSSGSSEQEVSGSGHALAGPLGRARSWGGTHERLGRSQPPGGARAHTGWSSTVAQGAPITGVRGSRSDGSGLAAAGRAAPNAGSVVSAPGPQSLQLRGPSLGKPGPPPKAPELPGTSSHSAQTPVRQLLCIYSHGSVAVSRGGVSPWTLSDFRPSSRRENPGWVAGPGLSPLWLFPPQMR